MPHLLLLLPPQLLLLLLLSLRLLLLHCREVLKMQPMLAYTDNGTSVVKHCIVGRYAGCTCCCCGYRLTVAGTTTQPAVA
jgi:hypothetical protein